MTIYKHFCQSCKKQTAHIIFMIRRMRGCRLKCSNCGRNTKRYYNLKKLIETTFEEMEKTNEKTQKSTWEISP